MFDFEQILDQMLSLSALWKGIKFAWPVLVLVAVVLLFRIFFEVILPKELKNLRNIIKFRRGAKWRSDRDLIQWLRRMNPTEFEEYIADLFRRLGYKTKTVGGPNDGGIDVIAEKDGVKHYIQCKKYFYKHQVGSPEIRNFYGSIADYVNGEGWFITTSKFTPEAEKFAEGRPIILINQFKLAEYIHLAEKKGFDSKPQVGKNLKCSECGSSLVERESKYGKFLGCSNYPKCKFIKKSEK